MAQIFKITKPSPSVIFMRCQERVVKARRQKITVRYSIAVMETYLVYWCTLLKSNHNLLIICYFMQLLSWWWLNESLNVFSESSISEVLHKLTVRVVSNEDCKRSYGPIIHNSTLCAIGVQKGTGTCQVRFNKLWAWVTIKIQSFFQCLQYQFIWFTLRLHYSWKNSNFNLIISVKWYRRWYFILRGIPKVTF